MLNLSRRQWAVRLLAGLLGLSSLALQAQDAPAAKIIVGFPAGGSFDAIARLIAEMDKDVQGLLRRMSTRNMKK